MPLHAASQALKRFLRSVRFVANNVELIKLHALQKPVFFLSWNSRTDFQWCVCVCVCERECRCDLGVRVCVCVCERKRERLSI